MDARTDDRRQTRIRGLLLDLDGTLVDTAPDMVRVLDILCDEYGAARVPYGQARNRISTGVYTMLELAFGELPQAEATRRRERFLTHYADTLSHGSQLFDGVAEVLNELDATGIPWGVVTNKPSAYSEPLLDALGVAQRAQCIVSGDSTPHAKPHPEPLLAASRALAIDTDACLFVGDADIDIRAGKAAGMFTVAAAYGYMEQPDSVHSWCADGKRLFRDPAR